jgi:hypothetical protein
MVIRMEEPMNSNEQKPKSLKKSYQTPELRVYGDVKDIIQSSGTPGSHIDAARGPAYGADRTH